MAKSPTNPGKAKVIQMHDYYIRTGLPMRKVAKEYGVSVQYVSAAFHRYGLPARDRNGRPKS